MSFRAWLSVITVVLIAIVLFFARHELVDAWRLLSQVNLWWLSLIIPLTAMSYLSEGEMIFSYLRQKRSIQGVKPWTLARLSLEMNFVNHILPSGGVSGISYGNWRLGKLGVSTGKATMAQMVRYVAGFGATIALLILSVVIVTLDGGINRWMIFMSSGLVFGMVCTTLAAIFLLSSPTRVERFSRYVTRFINRVVRRVTFGRVKWVLMHKTVHHFFDEMHDDYLALSKDKKLLIRPFLWGLGFTMIGISQFFVVFQALGETVNPASILIGYSVASLAGFAVATPGGMGAYEAAMVLVLGMGGTSHGVAIAGVVLARILIMIVTIAIGYIFYQATLIRYGRRKSPVQRQ